MIDDKKKLLVTASTFPRWHGDTEPRFILDISKALSEYYDVTVLVPACPEAKGEEVLEGVNVIRYHYFPIHKWETLCYPGAIVPRIKEKKIRFFLVPFLLIGLRRSLNKLIGKFDVVHSHWLIPQGIMQYKYKTPYILTGHGGDVASLNFAPFKGMKQKAIERSSKFTVVSKDLKEISKSICPSSNAEIISMGCDLSKFSPQNRKSKYFNQGETPVILFVGRLAEKKGVKYLIRAMSEVNAKLVIVGDGPLKEELYNQAVDLSDKIEFLGSKSHELLPEIYASADIFVAPSITSRDGDKEGLPTTIIEAMASGTTVIASDSGGISEIITNKKTGLLVEEKNVEQLINSINYLINNKDMCKELREAALKEVAKYDYKNIAFKFKKIIDDCIRQ